MDEAPKDGSLGVLARVKEIEQKQIESGELAHSPNATFRFPYLKSPFYLNAPNKDAIDNLDIPSRTIAVTEAVIADLALKPGISLSTLIPETDEERLHIIPSLGMGGRAISAKEVRIYFDPDHPKIIESLDTWKEKEIAHELNHAARFQAGQIGFTLLDDLIGEGLATHYEEHWGGHFLPTPWGNSLTPEQVIEQWTQAKTELHQAEYDRQAWFFGRNQLHPVWTGYALGTTIVNAYFQKNPQQRMRDVVSMHSLEILNRSGF